MEGEEGGEEGGSGEEEGMLQILTVHIMVT